MAKAKKEATFENDLESLESIVTALEEGGLSLDDALKQFESGIKLSRRCEKALSEAEKKIEILTRNVDGELEAEPFDESAPPTPPAKPTPAPAKPSPAKPASAPVRPAPPVQSEPEPTPEPDDEDLLF
jgi:exodeoxyribonuclease VII small subunit